MIRLAGFDLDGTLLTPDKKITPHTQDVLERCAKKNIALVPVTGRPFAGIPMKLRQMPFIRYAISSNGSVTGRVPDGTVIRSFMMPSQTVRSVLSLARRAAGTGRLIAEVFTAGEGFHDPVTDRLLLEKYKEKPQILAYFRASRKTVTNLSGFISGKEFENISLMFENREDRDAARVMLRDVPGIRVIVPARTDLEIVCAGADKGRSLLELARDLGVRPSEILAIGDGSNDRELLSCAGISVAMGNAQEELRVAADYVAQDNEHDGMARALEKFVLGM